MPLKDPAKRKVAARIRMRLHQARWRNRVLMFFGGMCGRCENNDSRVLQLDHVNGGGNRERNRNGNHNGGYQMGKLALNAPGRFQVLCANCNWIKRFELGEHGGVIPDLAVGG